MSANAGRNSVPGQTLLQKVLVRAARRSWRWRHAVNFIAGNAGVRVPVERGIGLDLLDREADIAPLMRLFHKAGCRGAFVDIGANIGIVMLSLVKIDRTVPYIGFEPSARAAAYIQRLIEANGLASTHSIYPVALADKCGASVLMTNGAQDVSATIDTELRPSTMYRERIAVCVSTGDLLLSDCGPIDVIKIDVEGSEVRVLGGLGRTIQRHRPALVMEIMPYRQLEEGSYAKGYFGDLTEAQRQQLVDGRRRHMDEIAAFVSGIDYQLYQMRDGVLHAACPGDSSPANQDFVALPHEGRKRFTVDDLT